MLKKIREKRNRKKLQKALPGYDLPSFPAVVTKVREVVKNPQSSALDVAEAIKLDPALSIKMLSVVNSGAFALRSKVENLGQAVAMLGMANVETMVFAVSFKQVVPDAGRAFDAPGFWRAAARRACLGQALAEIMHPKSRSECFTLGLLEDMAIPLLAHHRGEDYDGVLMRWKEEGGHLAHLEQEVLGFTHAEVGGWLCQEWDLPDKLADAIGGHHTDPGGDNPCPPAVTLVAKLPLEESAFDEETVGQMLRDVADLPEDTIGRAVEAALPATRELEGMLV